MPTAPATIDPVPTPVPSTDDPANFDERADALLGWFPDGAEQIQDVADVTYANALEVFETASELQGIADVAADAAGLLAKSNSTLTVGAGTKTIHFLAAKPDFAVNDQVVIVLRSDTSIRMIGTVATFDGSDDMTVTVVSSGVFGSGSYSSWFVIHAAFLTGGAEAADYWEGTTDAAAATPAGLVAAAAFGTLTDNTTVTWAVATQGFNVKLTLTANGHTIGAPTGLKDGLVYVLNINPATYTVSSWNSIWDFGAAGAPSLPASAWSKITAQYNSARNKLEAGVWRGA